MLIVARSELDHAKRKEMYHDLQMMIWEDGGYVLPLFFNHIDGGNKRVQGFVANPISPTSNFRAAEMVWFA